MMDRLWLWCTKVNFWQEHKVYGEHGLAESRITAEQAIQQTGIRNVFIANGLELNEQESVASMPSAQRLICKSLLHEYSDGKGYVDYEGAEARLLASKGLAANDRRVEGVFLDDLSTGSIEAGVKPDHLSKLQYINATIWPYLPLSAAIYTMSLELKGLADMLRHLEQIVLATWQQANEIETLPQAVARCTELSGNKPILLCVYLWDFGNETIISRSVMQRHLDVAEELVRSQRITGIMFCGTSLMDIGLESVECVFDWIKKVGHEPI